MCTDWVEIWTAVRIYTVVFCVITTYWRVDGTRWHEIVGRATFFTFLLMGAGDPILLSKFGQQTTRLHAETSRTWHIMSNFNVLLTLHLSMTLVNDQLDTQLLYFIIRLLQSSTCFEQSRAYHHEVKLY